MIQKLRRKFIWVTMLSTFAVLFVIIGTLNVANYISMKRSSDKLLDLIADNNGTFPEFFMGRPVDFEGDDEDVFNPDFFDESGMDRDLPFEEGDFNFEQPDREEDEWMEGFGRPDGKDGMKPPELPSEKDLKEYRNNFSNETPYETRFFSVRYEPLEEISYTAYTGRIVSVSEDEAIGFAETALYKFQHFAFFRGYVGNYRYKITPDEDGGRLVVFLDTTKEKKNFENVLKYSLILSAVGLFAVFILVWYFSKKVFKPVEESDRKQKQFITDASHELKTPLTIISANVEVMEMESEENEWSKSIKNQVNRMNGLVEQMVTLSRLDESTELVMQEFALSDAISETAEAYIPVAERNGQELILDIEEGIRFTGDEGKIRQMMGLLLDNATKYATCPDGYETDNTGNKKEDSDANAEGSSAESKCRIKVTLKKHGKKNSLTVWNTVSSTEPGNKDQLFERFYRPDESRNSKKGGSGIGLAIVKSVAEAHKGKVTAYSEDGKSIAFDVIL